MSTSDPVIRPRAGVVRVYDGDTTLFLLDIHGRGLSEDGCETTWVRLRDYSARELSDTAATDPKGWGRVDGPTAKSIAQQLLSAASEITVELLGPEAPTHQVSTETLGRYVGWVWVDGQSLGELLLAQHAVAKASVMGDPER